MSNGYGMTITNNLNEEVLGLNSLVFQTIEEIKILYTKASGATVVRKEDVFWPGTKINRYREDYKIVVSDPLISQRTPMVFCYPAAIHLPFKREGNTLTVTYNTGDLFSLIYELERGTLKWVYPTEPFVTILIGVY